MAGKREAVTPKEIVESLLRAAGPRLVLVGGQALAFWMDRYDIAMPTRVDYVSRDVDFLAESAGDVSEVKRLAKVLGGQAVIPKNKALTSLVGQAVREISDEEFINVDVVFRVLGAEPSLRSRVVDVQHGDVQFKVMHPLDVLKSRLDNLYRLREKRGAMGEAQLHAAIGVVQALFRDSKRHGSPNSKRSVALIYASFVERIARGDAGRKVAERFGIHVADAIEPSEIETPSFHTKKLPRLLTLMSNARRAALVRS
jgi:hypothetical protein